MSKFFVRYGVISTLMIIYFAVCFDKQLISMAIIPIRSEFGFSATQAGLMMSAYSLGYALVSLPGGWIADKIGYKRVILFCLGLSVVCAVLFPLATVLSLFILIRFLLGFAHGSVPASTTKGIAVNYGKERRVMLQSVWFVAQNIAGFVALCVGAWIISLNWQYAYWTAAIMYVLVILLSMKALPTMKQFQRESDDAKKGSPAATHQSSISYVFKNRNMWIFTICIFLFNLILNGANNWYATFLSTHFSRNLVEIGTILSLSSLISIGCAPLTGWLLSKVFKGRENWFIFFSTIFTALLFVLMAQGANLWISVVCIYVAAYTTMFPFVAIKTLPQRMVPENYIGTAMGVITAVSSFGGFVAPTLIGYILDVSSGTFERAFIVLAVLGVIAGLIALFGLKTRESGTKNTAGGVLPQ